MAGVGTARRNDRPGGRAIERLLKNFVPPKRDTDSSPEIQLLQYIRIAGLPKPVPQFRVWLSPTRWVDLDFAWPWLKIFIEFDPYKFHGNRDKYMLDAERRLKLRELGWEVIVVTDDELDSGCKLAMSVARRLIAKARPSVAEPGKIPGQRRDALSRVGRATR